MFETKIIWPVVGIFAFLFLLKLIERLFDQGIRKLKRGNASWDAKRKDFLYSDSEWEFLSALRSALPDGYEVWTKVRLLDIIEPRHRGDLSFRSRLAQKHVDYVITSGRRILGAVELNDPSHLREDRRERDEFVEAAFRAANSPLVWVWVSKHYDPNALRMEMIAKGILPLEHQKAA